ncbi:putative nuclease HARBI1 [Orchesella cincta]|uniref:Putative nuclease HARBI1 n=1 Tax=Orchesella cincta TaxID=48709 RepID=A0A1D2M0R1_ORCCI|nr:putative nuclease HARBI1 [Orchesella cincta]
MKCDSGYPLDSILLTPFANSSTNPIELAYNKAHCKTRCIVEQTIGHWKTRFRALCRSGGYLSYKEAKTCKLIVCSAILHNICKRYLIPLLPEDEDGIDSSIEEEPDPVFIQRDPQGPASEARRRIAERLFDGRA